MTTRTTRTCGKDLGVLDPWFRNCSFCPLYIIFCSSVGVLFPSSVMYLRIVAPPLPFLQLLAL